MMREFMFEEEMPSRSPAFRWQCGASWTASASKSGSSNRKRSAAVSAWPLSSLPIDHENERETLKLFIAEAVERVCGEQPKTLAESERAIAEPPHTLPTEVVAAARAEGVRLDQRHGSAWMHTSATR